MLYPFFSNVLGIEYVPGPGISSLKKLSREDVPNPQLGPFFLFSDEYCPGPGMFADCGLSILEADPILYEGALSETQKSLII